MTNPTQPKRETRAQRRIRLACEEHGFTLHEATWEPIGAMIEMSGREGGWYVFVSHNGEEAGNPILGYSTEDVIESIRRKAEWLAQEEASSS